MKIPPGEGAIRFPHSTDFPPPHQGKSDRSKPFEREHKLNESSVRLISSAEEF
jgi:hypothetical protein